MLERHGFPAMNERQIQEKNKAVAYTISHQEASLLAERKYKNVEKQSFTTNVSNRGMYNRKYVNPPPVKRKTAPVFIRMSNPSVEAILREKEVEVKDLESQVSYLQYQLKDMKLEKKTLVDVQVRQEKEIKKFNRGVGDIPTLIKSHKDEIKAAESSAATLRRELRDCQKEVKVKCDILLRKEQHLDKLSSALKQHERQLQEAQADRRHLKADNRRLEDESKKLQAGNEELKSKTDRMAKKIQQMTNTILTLEEQLGTAEHFKSQFKEDLCKLQKKYDELVQQETAFKKILDITRSTNSTQTVVPETTTTCCMTDDVTDDVEVKQTKTQTFASVACMTENTLDREFFRKNSKSVIDAWKEDALEKIHYNEDSKKLLRPRDAFSHKFPPNGFINLEQMLYSKTQRKPSVMPPMNRKYSTKSFDADSELLQSQLPPHAAAWQNREHLKSFFKKSSTNNNPLSEFQTIFRNTGACDKS